MTARAARRSAGLLLFRRTGEGLEVLLGHMGGSYYARKDAGAWTVPKGEYEPDEPAREAARGEFREEGGVQLVEDSFYIVPCAAPTLVTRVQCPHTSGPPSRRPDPGALRRAVTS